MSKETEIPSTQAFSTRSKLHKDNIVNLMLRIASSGFTGELPSKAQLPQEVRMLAVALTRPNLVPESAVKDRLHTLKTIFKHENILQTTIQDAGDFVDGGLTVHDLSDAFDSITPIIRNFKTPEDDILGWVLSGRPFETDNDDNAACLVLFLGGLTKAASLEEQVQIDFIDKWNSKIVPTLFAGRTDPNGTFEISLLKIAKLRATQNPH